MSLHKSRNIQPSKILLYKHLLSKISQNLKTKQSGFTLIELLVSMVILTIVVGMTGTGLVFIMSKNTSSDSEITQQANLRRALDFIGDEVRSASVVNQTPPVNQIPTTNPAWTRVPTASSTATTSSTLYLEIPTPVTLEPADINALLASPSPSTIKIPNHGLVNTNAVKISGTNLPSDTAQTINTTSTYYVSSVTATTPDTFQLITGSGSPVSFTSTPQNFAIRRLVFYYTADYVNDSGWKGERILYRATGNCAPTTPTLPNDPSNCLAMVDSLRLPLVPPSPAPPEPEKNLPVFINLVGSKQATIYLNGQLCNPPSMANVCAPTPAPPEKPTNITNVSLTAISRATLK